MEQLRGLSVNGRKPGSCFHLGKQLEGQGTIQFRDILSLQTSDAPTICYARVSSHDQKDDLERQQIMLESYWRRKGMEDRKPSKILAPGMNYKKRGLNTLLEMILRKQMNRLVITHKDRLLRFGSELVFALCELQGIEIVIIHKGEQPSFEEELAKDVLEIITVFSARLYGSRSHKNKKLIDDLNRVAQNVEGAIKLNLIQI